MKPMLPALVAVAPLICACGQSTPNSSAATDYSADAQRIARSHIIVDTHIDVPFRLQHKFEDVSAATASGDFDYPRAVAGGLDAPFMSIYTEAGLEKAGTARETADELIDIVESIAASAPDRIAIATSPAEVRENFARGVMSLPLGMENGSPLEGNLGALKHYFDRGIRYITLAHSESNHISDSSYDENRPWGGLSEFGVEVVREMNRFGIIVDVSHVSDEAFWDVLEISSAPVIASHSSARHFTPGWERNMSDEMISALADKGGVIHINFGSSFITKTARDYDAPRFAAGRAWLEENPGKTMSDMMSEWMPAHMADAGPYPYATLEDVLDHFDHVVALVGVDHVGIGSDYDGVGDTLPTGLKDVSSYPNLIEGLLRRGYSEDDIAAILGENLLRVWQQVEDGSAKMVEVN